MMKFIMFMVTKNSLKNKYNTYLDINWWENILFIDVDEINGVAIMTDTDNSKLKAISYYQNIYFSSE